MTLEAACHDKLMLALQGRVGRKLPTPIQGFGRQSG
jgi:hypothetical protein